MTISKFQGDYRWLSNFWPAPVEWGGITFPAIEHAYQAAKTLDPEVRLEFSKLNTAGEAKKAGRNIAELRADWEMVKISVMHELLRQKFSIPELKEKLLATGDQELIEGNHWNDTFWGVCKGVGQNHLGKLIMQVRKDLREIHP